MTKLVGEPQDRRVRDELLEALDGTIKHLRAHGHHEEADWLSERRVAAARLQPLIRVADYRALLEEHTVG